MINWLWLIAAFVCGSWVGIGLMCFLVAGDKADRHLEDDDGNDRFD